MSGVGIEPDRLLDLTDSDHVPSGLDHHLGHSGHDVGSL